MNITVREALQIPVLKNANLVAGEAGLDRIITSVNFMEVPEIIKYVKKGEFLVTTTYPIKDNITAQQTLIPNLEKSGVAALAIKPVFYNNKVPDIMIELANKLNFPIIELPKDASFNEILNPVLGEILNRQANILRRNEEIHKAFTNIVLGGGSISEIAQMLSNLQGNPVSIHAFSMRRTAFGIPDNAKTDIYNYVRDIVSDFNQIVQLIDGRIGSIKLEHSGQVLDAFVHPITVAQDNYGYIVIWLINQQKYEINALEQASTVAALEIEKIRAVNEVERRFRSQFIQDIISNNISSRAVALSRGQIYGWDLSSSFLPVLLEIDNYEALYCTDQNKLNPTSILKQLWNAVTQTTSTFTSDGIVVDIGSCIIILIKTQKRGLSGRENGIAESIIKGIQQKISSVKNISITTGIGRVIDDVMNLKEGFEQAKQALEIGRVINGPGSLTSYNDLGAYRVLVIGRNNPEMLRFSREMVGGLIEYDKKNKGELMRTLEVILECNGNIKDAAIKLYTHYNTIRYRAKSIEKITGTSLNKDEDRLNLQLALRIQKLNKIIS